MKIEVKTRGSKEFYNEMLYVVTYFKKFIKNPKRKAWQYTKYLYLYIAISILFATCFAVLYVFDKEWYSLVFVGMFLLILMFTLVLLISVKNRIKLYLNDKSDKTIDINKEAICYSSDAMNLKINKDNISVIEINKYSICILPKEMNGFAISISNDYIDDFLKGVNEEGYSELVVDNRKA